MKNQTYLKQIQNRLPDDIVVEDQTNIEFTEDEFIDILSWIKFFNEHYKIHGKNEHPIVIFPSVSKRIYIDFGLYRFPNKLIDLPNFDKHIIYISKNSPTVLKSVILTWNL